jgi:4a-hydroxytetrahydrobiopterin dehydratase
VLYQLQRYSADHPYTRLRLSGSPGCGTVDCGANRGEADMPALSKLEIERALGSGDLPGWRLGDGEIVKNFKFASFLEAIAFIDRLAQKAEAADHHPDLENHYNRVRIALHTWNESAVTEKDIALAREIEGVAGG